jgi:hypothetical protein
LNCCVTATNVAPCRSSTSMSLRLGARAAGRYRQG